MEEIPEVKVGDTIYIPGGIYLSRGVDDYDGGKATVSKVEEGISGGNPATFVTVAEKPSTQYNWNFLSQRQEKLKAIFGDKVTKSTPDYRREFNSFY